MNNAIIQFNNGINIEYHVLFNCSPIDPTQGASLVVGTLEEAIHEMEKSSYDIFDSYEDWENSEQDQYWANTGSHIDPNDI